MRQKDFLESVSMFVEVAEAGSFSEAARRLGISPSAVSQSIRTLEHRLGISLFLRSTRSVSLTDVGNDYLLATAPALSQLKQASQEVSGRAGLPTGLLRLTMPRAPFELFLAEALSGFQTAFPEIELEIAVEARMIDIVKERFDGGIRYGNNLQKDMVAVPIAPKSEAILAASPAYIATYGLPDCPSDLFDHRGLMCRSQSTGAILPWRLENGGETTKIIPGSTTIVHDLASQIQLSLKGLGILNAPAALISDHLESGKLSRVLPAWFTPLEALYLYFPSRRHQSPALRALIGFLAKPNRRS